MLQSVEYFLASSSSDKNLAKKQFSFFEGTEKFSHEKHFRRHFTGNGGFDRSWSWHHLDRDQNQNQWLQTLTAQNCDFNKFIIFWQESFICYFEHFFFVSVKKQFKSRVSKSHCFCGSWCFKRKLRCKLTNLACPEYPTGRGFLIVLPQAWV